MSTVVGLGALVLPAFICSFAIGIVMIIGSRKMMRLESYRWAMAASILALLPCSPVGLLGLVMGIWSLVVLNRRNVIAAFDAQTTARGRPSSIQPPAGAKVPSDKTSGSGSGGVPGPRREQTKKSNAILWIAVVLIVVICAACFLSPVIVVLYRSFAPMTDSRSDVNDPAPREALTSSSAKTQVTRPVASPPESPWGWTMGPSGPVLTDLFGRVALNLQPKQIEEVNKVLQATYQEYPALELRNTEQHTNEAGHVIVRISPFPESIARLEDHLWSQLDAILDPRQQSIARLNLKLDPPEGVPGISLSDLVRPGFFGWGKDGAYIEIWRVGAWYHWRVQSRGVQDSSRAPQLPDGYRRFWKEADEEAAGPATGATEAPPTWQEQGSLRRPVQPLPGGNLPPTQVAFSSDGKTLIALIGEDIHSWETGETTSLGPSLGRRPIGDFIHAARSGTLAPAGDAITLVRADGTVEFWDIASGKRLSKVNPGAAAHAVFAPDRHLAAVAGEDANVKLWDVATDSERASLTTKSPVTVVAFSSDGALLAGGCRNGTVRLWEVESGDALVTLAGQSSAVTCVAFSHDGRRLASGMDDGTLHLWFVETENREAMIKSSPGLSSAAFDPQRGSLVTGSADGTIQRWVQFPAPAVETPRAPPRVHLVRVGHVPVMPGERFAGMAIDGKYAYLCGSNLKVVDVSEPSRPRVVGVCTLPDGGEAVAVSGRYAYLLAGPQHLRIVDVADPTAPQIVGACPLGDALRGIAVQGQFAYVVDAASLRVIDVSNPTVPSEVGRCPGQDLDSFEGLAIAGDYAFVGADTGGLRVIDISDPRAPKEVSTFEGPGNALRVTIAGKYAYVAGGEDAVSLWIVDISDPRGPKRAGQFGDWVTGGGVAVQQGIAFLLGGELDIVDVSDPVAPKPVGLFSGSGDPGGVVGWQVAAAGNYVYLVGEAGLSILRVVRTRE